MLSLSRHNVQFTKVTFELTNVCKTIVFETQIQRRSFTLKANRFKKNKGCKLETRKSWVEPVTSFLSEEMSCKKDKLIRHFVRFSGFQPLHLIVKSCFIWKFCLGFFWKGKSWWSSCWNPLWSWFGNGAKRFACFFFKLI